jgi:CAAX protease family protein
VCPPGRRTPQRGRPAGSVDPVRGAEDAGTDGHSAGHGPDVETSSSPPLASSATPAAPAGGPQLAAPVSGSPVAAPAAGLHVAPAGAPPVAELGDMPQVAAPAGGSQVAAPAAVAPWGVPDPAQGYPATAGGPAADSVAGLPGPPAYGAAFPPAAPPRPPGIFGPSPPPRAPHRWGLGAYLLVEAVFLLVSALLGYVLAGTLTSSAGSVALALAVPTVCAAGLALLITRIRGNGPRVDLGLRLIAKDVGVGVACGLAGLMITIPASVLYVAIVGTDATSAVGEALGGVRAGPVLAVTIFVVVAFVAPLCEEIVYRGLLWGAVERLGANRWWALVITTVVFALAHFEFTRTPLLLVVAIPIGIARVITGRLSAGVIAHQINNLLPAVVLMLGVLGAVPMT